MKRALILAFLLGSAACSTSSNPPPYTNRPPGPSSASKTNDQYLSGVAYCENRPIRIGGVYCHVDYRHAFSRLSRDFYLGQVSVLQGCNGRSAKEISQELARTATYRLDLADPSQTYMTQISTAKTFAVELTWLTGAFSLKAAGATEEALFTQCP